MSIANIIPFFSRQDLSSWPRICNPPASVSWVLGLQAWAHHTHILMNSGRHVLSSHISFPPCSLMVMLLLQMSRHFTLKTFYKSSQTIWATVSQLFVYSCTFSQVGNPLKSGHSKLENYLRRLLLLLFIQMLRTWVHLFHELMGHQGYMKSNFLPIISLFAFLWSSTRNACRRMCVIWKPVANPQSRDLWSYWESTIVFRKGPGGNLIKVAAESQLFS